jgi:hypothetical protein
MGKKRPFDILTSDCTLFIEYDTDSFLYCEQWNLLEDESFLFESEINEELHQRIFEIINRNYYYRLEFYEPNEGVLSRYPIEKTPEITTNKVRIERKNNKTRLIW